MDTAVKPGADGRKKRLQNLGITARKRAMERINVLNRTKNHR